MIVGEDMAGIMQFVGGGNQVCVCVCPAEMPDIVLLSPAPRWFWVQAGISTTFNHMRYPFTEAATHFLEHGSASAVFDDIVQQGGDCQVLVASGFEYQPGHSQKVGDVGCRGALAKLPGMLTMGKQQRLFKAATQLRASTISDCSKGHQN
jgi:hypothetical protein